MLCEYFLCLSYYTNLFYICISNLTLRYKPCLSRVYDLDRDRHISLIAHCTSIMSQALSWDSGSAEVSLCGAFWKDKEQERKKIFM